MATKAEIAQKVVEKLGVVETGGTIDSDDSTLIQAKYDSMYAILAAQDLVSWGSGDDIPTSAEIPVVSLVANECLSEFIIPQDKQMIVSRDAQRAMDYLRLIEHRDYVADEGHYYY